MAISDQELLGYNPESKDIDRKRKLAELLTARGLEQPQGQMISGRYVAPSWTQNLSSLYNAYQGNRLGEEQDQRQLALAEQLRKQEGGDLSKFYELQYGGKEIPAQAQAGPMPDGGNIPIGTTTSEANPQAAFKFGLQSRSPMVRAQLAEMLKEKKVGENDVITRYNPMAGKTEIVAKGAEKYRAPLHFDVGNAIELRDPNDPTKVLQRIPKGMSPESAARLADEGIGGGGAPRPAMPTIGQGSPILTRPNASLAPNAPGYAQGAVTMPTVGGKAASNPYEDFNKSLVPPAGLPPKDARKWTAETNSPLTGESAKQVTGAINTISAIDDYRNLVSEATRTGIVSPEQQAKLGAARNTMNLYAKEAFNLGVLNGDDYKLINSLTADINNPKSLILSKQTLDNLIEKQRNTMGVVVQNVYGTQQKKIPAYVIDKLKPVKDASTANSTNASAPKLRYNLQTGQWE